MPPNTTSSDSDPQNTFASQVLGEIRSFSTTKRPWESKTLVLAVIAFVASCVPGLKEWAAANPDEATKLVAGVLVLVRLFVGDKISFLSGAADGDDSGSSSGGDGGRAGNPSSTGSSAGGGNHDDANLRRGGFWLVAPAAAGLVLICCMLLPSCTAQSSVAGLNAIPIHATYRGPQGSVSYDSETGITVDASSGK